jgi:predicted nucleic acid-binding protein
MSAHLGFSHERGQASLRANATVAWGEFLCGPLSSPAELAARQTVTIIEPLLAADAEKAAKLFRQTGRRSRSFQDCMIAAIAIRCGARLGALNSSDFAPFVPHGLVLA